MGDPLLPAIGVGELLALALTKLLEYFYLGR